MGESDGAVPAASAALGTGLSGPVELAGSGRSVVERCRVASGGTVVVKSYPQTADGLESFAAEAAGLAFSSGLSPGTGPESTADPGFGPRLLGTDPAVPLLVMTDLGDAPSLADLLLRGSAEAARTALLTWSTACGRLAVRATGRQQDLTRLRGAYGLPGPDQSGAAEHWLSRRIWSVPGVLASAGVTPSAGLADDLAVVAAIAPPGGYEVFSPGDICPDNNLLTPSGLRFIDFENAEYHSAFLDAAYLRMPFSSCWCVFRLPPELAAAAEAAYRAEVAAVHPDLASDAAWQPGLIRAVAAWTLHATCHHLERCLVGDSPMDDSRSQEPTVRQLLRYRWQQLGRELQAAGDLPAIAALMATLLAGTQHWQAPDLPGYPAFRAG